MPERDRPPSRLGFASRLRLKGGGYEGWHKPSFIKTVPRARPLTTFTLRWRSQSALEGAVPEGDTPPSRLGFASHLRLKGGGYEGWHKPSCGALEVKGCRGSASNTVAILHPKVTDSADRYTRSPDQ